MNIKRFLLYVALLLTFTATVPVQADSQGSLLYAGGDLLWAKRVGGSGDAGASAIALDVNGNIYTTGSFTGTVDFDPGPGTFNLTSANPNLSSVYISKLNSSGSFVWARSLGGAEAFIYSFGIALDANGNVYTTGIFDGIVDFDPGPDIFYLTSNSYTYAFVLKLDSSGSFVWAKSFEGEDSFIYSLGIALDANGNIYTTGHFQGTADFDPSSGSFTLTSAGNEDTFVLKLDSSGGFVWAKSMGGAEAHIYSQDISLDANGNIYTTGGFDDTVDFDPGLGMFNLTSVGDYDAFVLKLDSSGSFVGVKSTGGGNGTISASSLILDPERNIYTTGSFSGTIDFDPGPGTYNLTGEGGQNVFISKIEDFPSNTDVIVGTEEQGSYFTQAHQSLRKSYFRLNNGPAKIISTDETIRIASQRVIYGGWSYSEMMGLPFEQLTKEYLFPYYNNVAMDSQLRVSNVGGADTTIKVYLGDTKIDEYPLAAGGATRIGYPGKNGGPLRVTSSASDILATVRVLYGGKSYSELMGFPALQLTKDYLFPYYNNVAMDSQLRVSNVGGASTTINVYLGSSTNPIDSYTLAAGGATRKNYTGKNSGPLRVTSSDSNILTTIRVLYAGGSYSELMGFPTGQLSQEYWYPVYDNVAVDSQLRVSNVGSATTHITVYAGTEQIDSYDLAKGAATRKNYPKNTGPLHVVSSTQPILTTVRMLYGASYYEMTGLPDSQLSTQYFFPWYNNKAMDSELRFAVP